MKLKFKPKLKDTKRKKVKLSAKAAGAVVSEEQQAKADLRKQRKQKEIEIDKIDRKFHAEFKEYSGTSTEDLKLLAAHKPKDWAFKTKKEGRPSLVGPKKINVKLQKQIWPWQRLSQFFRQQNINLGTEEGRRWFILLENPDRKMNAQDQLDIFMMPPDTFFTVRHNIPKHWLIIEDKGGTIF